MNTDTRTRIAATLLVVGALTFTVGDLVRRLVEPSGSPKAVDITHAVGQHHGAWLLAGFLGLVAGLCLAPALLTLIPSAGARGSRVTTTGALMASVGAMASIGHTIAFYSPYSLFADARVPGTEVTAIDKASESSPLLIALIVLFIAGMMLGSIVLFVGLRRAGRVPIWSVVAVVVFVACGSTGGVVPGVIGIIAAAAAFVPAAKNLLR